MTSKTETVADLVERLKGAADRFLKWTYKEPYSGPPVISIPRHPDNIDALLSEAASTLTSLEAERAKVEAFGRAGGYRATPEHSWREWADEWRRDALAAQERLEALERVARQFKPVMSTDEAHSFGDALRAALQSLSGEGEP